MTKQATKSTRVSNPKKKTASAVAGTLPEMNGIKLGEIVVTENAIKSTKLNGVKLVNYGLCLITGIAFSDEKSFTEHASDMQNEFQDVFTLVSKYTSTKLLASKAQLLDLIGQVMVDESGNVYDFDKYHPEEQLRVISELEIKNADLLKANSKINAGCKALEKLNKDLTVKLSISDDNSKSQLSRISAINTVVASLEENIERMRDSEETQRVSYSQHIAALESKLRSMELKNRALDAECFRRGVSIDTLLKNNESLIKSNDSAAKLLSTASSKISELTNQINNSIWKKISSVLKG